jgi:hypothetical protein
MFFNLNGVKCMFLIPFNTYNIFKFHHDFWDTFNDSRIDEPEEFGRKRSVA